AADFAQPVLLHLRKLVHEACPEAEETVKWGMPFFDYKGPLCNMASFKQHCSFGFWKAALMEDALQLKDNNAQGMGNLGRITSLSDLPPDITIRGWIKEAKKLNDGDTKLPERKKKVKKEIEMPAEFQNALNKNKKALSTYTNFTPSHKYEYLEWITEAKTEETKNKRIASTIEMLNDGKSRHWKYATK
ncbi:MAG: YdeI/OmpD-associated family protein, partial [Ginsengibacter sp.]